MPLLTLDGVSLAFGHLPLLGDAALRIDPAERVALVGRNGTGKSSLLRILAGELPPDAGRVWRTPGLRVSRLEQDAVSTSTSTVREELVAAMARMPASGDAWDRDHRVDEVISRLGLPSDRAVRELSGGWRRRVHLGCALVGNPDLLLLDEPTNHLDIDAIEWLERHLVETFTGAVVVVTHDRAFARRLATRIVELDRGALRSWPGDYDTYVARKTAALDAEAKELERLDKLLDREEAWLRRGIKARRTRDEGRVKALEALRADRASRRAQVGSVRLSIETAESSGVTVFELDGVSKSFASPVVDAFSARVARGDRIGLIGPNGSGKTTLLRMLLGEVEPDRGEVRRGARLDVAYFDQQREQLDPDRSVAESVADGDVVTLGGQSRHVLGYLADFLFSKERAQSPVRSLSGGERNRLLLARLFAKPANVLVLDEPTNDLDLETLELLEERIGDFEGTVLLVTHDRAFLDNVVTSTWAFGADGRVTEYVGGWADYVRQAAAERAASAPAPATSDARPAAAVRDRAERSAPKKRTFNEEREYAALPSQIDALEAERRQLQAEVASSEFYKSPAVHITKVLARIEETGRELDGLLERWVTLESIGT